MDEQQLDTIYSIIGSRIREYRKRKEKPQKDLATQVGVSRTSIVNIEMGRQRLPIHLLWHIAVELGIEPSNLLPKSEEVSQQPTVHGVDNKTLKTIDNSSQGNADTRKKLLEFIKST